MEYLNEMFHAEVLDSNTKLNINDVIILPILKVIDIYNIKKMNWYLNLKGKI